MNTENKKTTDRSFAAPQLHLSVSPHVRSSLSVKTIMTAVLIALAPSFIASIVFFRGAAALLTIVCVATAVGAEYVANIIMKRDQTIGDLSAALTGLLVAFNLSPSVPLWMAALGSIFAIVVAKMVFGGLGCNFVNPALAGRVFLLASYPAPMTAFPATAFGSISGITTGAVEAVTQTTSSAASLDAISSATPLAAIKHALADGGCAVGGAASALKNLFWGNVGGCIGETSAFALLIGGIFLIAIRAVDVRIPLAYIFTVFALFWLVDSGGGFDAKALVIPTFHILGGGLFLGAFFMATDPVTSPITPRGRLIFGIGCGVLTFVIRKYGGYPEGVSFAILLMNLVVPLIDRYTRPAIYGEVKKRG